MTVQIGSLITDVSGKALTAEDKEILAHPLIGGVILFSRNYESRHQLKRLCDSIRAVRKTPLLIVVDQEGGQVQRFTSEFTRIPAMGEFGKIYANNANIALHFAKECAWLMATELLSMGVDMSLAPVLDLDKEKNKVIGQRAFHAHPQTVSDLAKAFMSGMKEAGMASTGKHFPGHGDVSVDSHKSIPIDDRELAEIENDDMLPFQNLMKAGIPAIMPAHIVFSAVDPLPVCFSYHWLTAILRGRLGFQGLIISDDMNMEGANISTDYADRFTAAKEAGCDFVLLCNNRKAAVHVLDKLTPLSHQYTVLGWPALAGRFSFIDNNLQNMPRWLTAHQILTESMTSSYNVGIWKSQL